VLDGLRLAVGTLTILPTGRVEVGRRVAAAAMVLAPVAVVPLGLAVAVIGWLGTVVAAPTLVTGVLVLAVLALGSRALHLDGLADTVDGLGAGWDQARALEVMRRGDVGPMGVVALILVLALQAASVAAILHRPLGWLVVAVLVLASRAAVAIGCARPVRAARATGLGAAVVGAVPVWATLLVWALVVTGCGVLGHATGWPVWVGLVSAAAAGLVVLALVGWCTRRLGGVTGDVLGAAVELALAALLVGFAI